jgi:hypothetical protein
MTRMTGDAVQSAYSARAVEYAEALGSINNAAAPDIALVTDRAGRAADLGVPGGTLGGVLAWYSLIHTDPTLIGDALTEFSRCVHLGGNLALGFFTGPALKPFDHAVTTAWSWPVDQLQQKVEDAGFTVTHTETRHDPGSRPHGAILARRRQPPHNPGWKDDPTPSTQADKENRWRTHPTRP